jgi:hypothetical protein
LTYFIPYVLHENLDKLLGNFIIEITVATLTLFLALTRGYSSLFMQILPLLYLIALFEIAMRYVHSERST